MPNRMHAKDRDSLLLHPWRRALHKAQALMALLPEAVCFKIMALHASLYIKPAQVLPELRLLKVTLGLHDKACDCALL